MRLRKLDSVKTEMRKICIDFTHIPPLLVTIMIITIFLTIGISLSDVTIIFIGLSISLPLYSIAYLLSFKFIILGKKRVLSLLPIKWRIFKYEAIKFCYITENKYYLGMATPMVKKRYTKDGQMVEDTTLIASMVFTNSEIDSRLLDDKLSNKRILFMNRRKYIADVRFTIQNADFMLKYFKGKIYIESFFAETYMEEVNYITRKYNTEFVII